MANHYHLSAKTGSRRNGKSAIAAAAYRAAIKLHSTYDGITRDFSRKAGVLETAIMTPEGAPDWTHDREQLWNRVETAEKRADARLYREFEVSLPRDVPDSLHLPLVRAWAKKNFVSQGMIADIAIHDVPAKDNGRNIHAHVMLTDRPLDAATETGFAKRKDRSWNQTDLVERARESWALYANRALERAGAQTRIDHRSLANQRAAALAAGNHDHARTLDREPEPKIGAIASAMEKRGIRSERGDLWRQVWHVNRWLQEKALAAWHIVNRQIEEKRREIALAREQARQAPSFAERLAQQVASGTTLQAANQALGQHWQNQAEKTRQSTNEVLRKHFQRQAETAQQPHPQPAPSPAEPSQSPTQPTAPAKRQKDHEQQRKHERDGPEPGF